LSQNLSLTNQYCATTSKIYFFLFFAKKFALTNDSGENADKFLIQGTNYIEIKSVQWLLNRDSSRHTAVWHQLA